MTYSSKTMHQLEARCQCKNKTNFVSEEGFFRDSSYIIDHHPCVTVLLSVAGFNIIYCNCKAIPACQNHEISSEILTYLFTGHEHDNKVQFIKYWAQL